MRIPDATYRLQLTPDFTFKDVASIVDYLDRLGVSHIYASPITRTRRGSAHGYDVVDPTAINEELGGREGFELAVGKAREHNLGWIQDIVPNHMAVDPQNHWLMDVLENGADSRYRNFFDIDWKHIYEGIRGRMLAPFLGSFYGEAIERGQIRLEMREHGLSATYYDLVLPLKISSYPIILNYRIEDLERELGRTERDFITYIGTVNLLTALPAADHLPARARQVRHAKQSLWKLYRESDAIHAFIDKNLAIFNGTAGDPRSFDLLDSLLAEQNFRLSFWKVATEEINYRRFFTINDLITLQVDDEEVFESCHKLIFDLMADGSLDGLRVDHIDGLYDPLRYLIRLRKRVPEAYIVVEKILQRSESVPRTWPIQGTTGYEALDMVTGLFCDGAKRTAFNRLYRRYYSVESYPRLSASKKRLIAEHHLAGDIDNLAHSLKRISSHDRHGNDLTLNGLRRALVEILAWFPVYRTYTDGNGVSSKARPYIEEAIMMAQRQRPSLTYELLYIKSFLLLDRPAAASGRDRDEAVEFIMRFQQISGPLMAKGFEDTFLYIYNRLLALNEVGGDPENFGVTMKQFHSFCEERVRVMPHSMNTLATHDTKRGEDVRARLLVLSEIPRVWRDTVNGWMQLNRRHRTRREGRVIPEANDEYFLYQTLIGAYPFDERAYGDFVSRIKSYIIKAVREAKVHTAWLKPDEEYEQVYVDFVDKILARTDDNQFLPKFVDFQKYIAHYGVYNSLSQTLIKIAMPGLPDFYQGSELWDFNLVDPDNRRPVDYDLRRQYLQDMESALQGNVAEYVASLVSAPADGRLKMFLIRQALKARGEQADLFRSGEYIPLNVTGDHADQVISFARRNDKRWAVTIAPRFLTSLMEPPQAPLGGDVWGNTVVQLPDTAPKTFHDAITETEIDTADGLSVALVLQNFPVALLIAAQD
jgi:(1->4)-alpha-D-glucan 1-alpha-D-glucosylmutase